jgi:hypothetical protein
MISKLTLFNFPARQAGFTSRMLQTHRFRLAIAHQNLQRGQAEDAMSYVNVVGVIAVLEESGSCGNRGEKPGSSSLEFFTECKAQSTHYLPHS